jgi:hypothetical protein
MALFVKTHDKPLTGKPKAMMIFPRDFDKMEYIMGFGIPILEYVSKDYDPIIITGRDSDITHYKKWGQVWGFVISHLLKMKDNSFKRADEMEGDDTNWEYNQEILLRELKDSFGEDFFVDLEKIFIIDPIDFILPQTSYVPRKESVLLNDRKNEFHDTVNSDPDELQTIEKYNQKVGQKYYSRCSVLAFGSHNKNVSMSLIQWAVSSANNFKMTYAFINDPAFYTPIFKEWQIPFTALYFANDNRGSRDFKEFPIGELQHLVWDIRKKSRDLLSIPQPLVKDKDFFFAGTIFQEKGGRIELYNKYLKDLRIPDSSLFIPQRANGIVYTKKNNDRYLNKLTDKFTDLHTDVVNHPLYAEHLIPSEYEDVVKRYKYGMLLRCVSFYDSLNFRPILYARLRILPFIDPGYDPQGLQIPLHIQEKLLVQDSTDIEKKVKYFNENPAERENLLDELEYKFSVKTFEKTWKTILSSYI